jgi:magnesium transporter
MISLYCWSSGQKAGLWINAELLQTHTEQLRNAPDVYWIDLDNPTPEEEKLVFEQFLPVHRLSLMDITREHREKAGQPHLPKVEEFPDYLFVVVNPLSQRLMDSVQGKLAHPERKGKGRSEDGEQLPALPQLEHKSKGMVTQLSTILTKKVLITHHYEPVVAIEELRAFLSKHEEQSERGPDYLFHLILDAMVDQFAPVLDHIHSTLDRIEEKVFGKPTQQLLLRMLKLKRRIILLRKLLMYEREVTARLARGDFTLIDEREMAYYRNVYDHVVRFTELVEAAREMATDLMQTHLSVSSHKLNEVMKVLTMISTVVLPMTLVAGIYGMNFDYMPELKEGWGYPFALVVMLLLGAGSFLFFRWKKWI